jgi:hypothetical protein
MSVGLAHLDVQSNSSLHGGLIIFAHKSEFSKQRHKRNYLRVTTII